MKKILLLIMCFLIGLNTYAFADGQWRGGTGEDTILETKYIDEIDTESFDKVVEPLDRLLQEFRQGCHIYASSTSQISSGTGTIVASNSAGTIRLMLENTATANITWADIDAGGEAASTTYYVYAGTATASDTDITFKISANSTTPIGLTYYLKLGNFYNNSSSNITLIVNESSVAGIVSHTGTIAHGGTIPLPTGYTEDQCTWMVSPSSDSGSIYGIIDGGAGNYISIRCHAIGTRVVTSQGKNANSNLWGSTTANYIIIGIK